MNDIVELAKERRTTLVAEMARLDNFIRVAESLLNPDDTDILGEELGESAASALGDDLLLGMDDQFLLIDDDELEAAQDAEKAAEKDAAKASGKGKGKRAAGSDATENGDDGDDPEASEDELLLTDAVAESDSKLDTHVGMRIRHRRWMMGIDQQELARLSGLTVGQIQRFEAGDSRAGTRQMREIASAMKVPLAFFLEGLVDGIRRACREPRRRPPARMTRFETAGRQDPALLPVRL